MSRVFPDRCPDCGGRRRNEPWQDPIRSERTYEATVHHRPGCRFYRGERDRYDRSEAIAHLQAIGAQPVADSTENLRSASPPA